MSVNLSRSAKVRSRRRRSTQHALALHVEKLKEVKSFTGAKYSLAISSSGLTSISIRRGVRAVMLVC